MLKLALETIITYKKTAQPDLNFFSTILQLVIYFLEVIKKFREGKTRKTEDTKKNSIILEIFCKN